MGSSVSEFVTSLPVVLCGFVILFLSFLIFGFVIRRTNNKNMSLM